MPFEDFLALSNFESSNARSLAGARTHFVPLAIESQLSVLLETSTPMIDGAEFSTNPLQMLENGEWASDKDIIIGHTNGEVNTFLYTEFTREGVEVC